MEDFKCKTFAVKDGLLITAWGDVYTYNYRNTGKFKKLKQLFNRGGYPLCSVKGKHYLVHRLVAEAFLPNPENKPEVDHINACPSDCRVSNLRWVFSSENKNNPITLERMSKVMTNHPSKSKSVYQYTLDGEYIREWPSTREIGRVLGIDNSAISKCCRGELAHAGNYHFSYVKCERMEPAATHKKKVYQYTLDGKYVKRYESVRKAALEVGGNERNISTVCRGKRKSSHGFIWSYSPLS